MGSVCEAHQCSRHNTVTRLMMEIINALIIYTSYISTLHSHHVYHTNKRKVMKNFVLEGNICYEAWDSHTGVIEDSSLLGSHPVSLGELLLMF